MGHNWFMWFVLGYGFNKLFKQKRIMTQEDKRTFLRDNGWLEVLKDLWIDETFKVTNPNIDYYLISSTTDHAYNVEVERQKKSIVKFKDVVYYVTTDPFEVGEWVITPRGDTFEVTEQNLDMLKSHNASKIISCTNNDGMKHVGYLIIDFKNNIWNTN